MNRNEYMDDLYISVIEGMKLYADDKEIAEVMMSDDETKQILKFGNDPMVDEQYRKDLFGDNDVKLEIETDDDMLEALARFYSNYRTGDKTRDDVATSMSSWLLELQELRKMKKNLKRFIKDFSEYEKVTRVYNNRKDTEYANGKVAALNVIASWINDYGLVFDDKEK